MTNAEIINKIKEYKELQVFIKQLEDEAEAAKAAIIAENGRYFSARSYVRAGNTPDTFPQPGIEGTQ